MLAAEVRVSQDELSTVAILNFHDLESVNAYFVTDLGQWQLLHSTYGSGQLPTATVACIACVGCRWPWMCTSPVLSIHGAN